VEERWAEGRIERFPELLTDFLRLKVDVIVQASSAGAVAAKKVATTVPVVFVGVNDPVRLGLVESLARPGGNLTGFSLAFTEEFAAKWVELLTEAVPRASRVAVLLDALHPRSESLRGEMRAAVSPSAFAVVMFTTGSNFVGCSTGRSAVLAPSRHRSWCGQITS
jgi:putative tryptophan/tyrosine transport system substrate-binding protein